MEVSTEEANFIAINELFSSILPKRLQIYFIEQWNNKYPNQKWQSDNVSGHFLVDQLSNAIRKTRSKEELEMLKNGKEQKWDIRTLEFVLLYSDLKLIQVCRKNYRRKAPLRASEEIESLIEMKNLLLKQEESMLCPSDTFTNIVKRIRKIVRNVFGTDAETEVYEFVKSQIGVPQLQLTGKVEGKY